MPQIRIGQYEGLFLLAQNAASDLNSAVEHIRGILTRAEAEILVLRKWEERKLAYPVKGQKRGTYLLAYFKARATQIANIERDCTLSEHILRALILAADHMGETELELAKREVPAAVEAKLTSPAPAAAPAAPAPAPATPAPAPATPAPTPATPAPAPAAPAPTAP